MEKISEQRVEARYVEVLNMLELPYMTGYGQEVIPVVDWEGKVWPKKLSEMFISGFIPVPGASGYSGYSGLPGERGPDGLVGLSGYSGWSGVSGYSGTTGSGIGLPGTSGFSGYSGGSGFSGYSGINGLSGWSGLSGYSGIDGLKGDTGISGYSGFSGYSGWSGHSGLSGYSGANGSGIGIPGPSGYSGFSGYSGDKGIQGSQGSSGFSGYSGATSTSGFSGFSGVSGFSGYNGLSGFSGYSGAKGDIGQSGWSGMEGYSGYSGWSGISGYSGWNVSGFSGYSGFDGLNGVDGASGFSGYSGTNYDPLALALKRDLTLIGDLHGFDAPPGSGNFALSNTGASISVSLLANAGSFKINGTSFTARQIDLTFTASLGQNFIYCALNAGVPTLYATQTPWSILDLTIIPVATLNWDGTTAILSDELHLSNRNLIQHKKEHDTDGARWVSGFATTFGSSANNTFSTASGLIRDEERYHDIAARTQCMIGYRNSALTAMIFDAASTRFAKLVGVTTGIPYYDNAGTLTALSASQYGVSYIYATNRKLPVNGELACILGQAQYSNVANAQAASQPALSGMNVAEWKLLYRVIYRNSGGNLNFIQADDLRMTTTGLAVSGSGITSLTAVGVSFNPSGSIVATNVQSAIEELDTTIGDIATILVSI